MSKLEDLIQKLCPNGVEWKELGEVCEFKRGQPLKSTEAIEGNIPVISGGQRPAFYHNISNRNGNIITVAGSGAYAGFVSYWNNPIFCSDSFTVNVKDFYKLNIKYIYYFLKNKQNFIYSLKKGAGIAHVYAKDISNFKIPIPPLKIQEEIVHILDSFTELTNELTNELTARKKQYEFYRDNLLFNTDKKSKMIELSNVIDKINNINWKNIPNFDNYQYIDLSSVDIQNKSINNTTIINASNHPSRAQQEIKTNDVIFGTTRPTQMRIAIVPPDLNNQICSTGYCVLRANTEKVLPKWIYYNLSTSKFYTYIEKFQQGASYPAISDTLIKKYTISIPPIDIQSKIIYVLDNFESLCNDITKGLPAEIEARKKQYEYYRDKLLTFKDISENK